MPHINLCWPHSAKQAQDVSFKYKKKAALKQDIALCSFWTYELKRGSGVSIINPSSGTLISSLYVMHLAVTDEHLNTNTWWIQVVTWLWREGNHGQDAASFLLRAAAACHWCEICFLVLPAEGVSIPTAFTITHVYLPESGLFACLSRCPKLRSIWLNTVSA